MSAVQGPTITTRTVTFPPIYFQDMDESEVEAKFTEVGGTNLVTEEDGFYTITLPLDKYSKLVDSLHEGMKQTMDAIPNSEDYEHGFLLANMGATSATAE